MVYEDAEKLYAEVRTDMKSLIENTMRVLYPGSLSLSSVASAATSGPLTIFAHNATSFARREIVRVPLTSGGISSRDVLQTTSDGKEGYIMLDCGAGGGFALPSQISIKNLNSEQRSYLPLVTVIDSSWNRRHSAQRGQRTLCAGK
jgi:alpha-mannosidase